MTEIITKYNKTTDEHFSTTVAGTVKRGGVAGYIPTDEGNIKAILTDVTLEDVIDNRIKIEQLENELQDISERERYKGQQYEQLEEEYSSYSNSHHTSDEVVTLMAGAIILGVVAGVTAGAVATIKFFSKEEKEKRVIKKANKLLQRAGLPTTKAELVEEILEEELIEEELIEDENI